MASFIVALAALVPRLRLSTFAPWSTAHVIAELAALLDPEPEESSTLSGMTSHCQQTPATPAALLPRAPMMPATEVPCPLSSVVSLLPPAKFHPVTRRP